MGTFTHSQGKQVIPAADILRELVAPPDAWTPWQAVYGLQIAKAESGCDGYAVYLNTHRPYLVDENGELAIPNPAHLSFDLGLFQRNTYHEPDPTGRWMYWRENTAWAKQHFLYWFNRRRTARPLDGWAATQQWAFELIWNVCDPDTNGIRPVDQYRSWAVGEAKTIRLI